MKILQAANDERDLKIWEQLSNGSVQRTTRFPEFSFFVRRADLSEDVRRFLTRSSLLRKHTVEGDWHRFTWANDEARKLLCFGYRGKKSPLAEAKIEVFEGDIRAVRRFLVDNDCEIARPRRSYLDIETDSRVPFARKEEARILSIVTKDDSGNTYRRLLVEDTDAAEKEMLHAFWEEDLKNFDQLLAWNGDRFDFPVLLARSKGARLRIDYDRWLKLDHLALFKRMNTAAESGDEKQSMALQAIAQQFLGEGKDDFDSSKTWDAWAAGGASRARLLQYNEKDVDLLMKLEAKTGFCELFQAICEVCRVIPDSLGLLPTQQMDGFMLRLGNRRGIHFKTKRRLEETEQFEGAYVMKPAEGQGILKNIHVADFASLYPAIMLSWNMSPETRLENKKAEKIATAPITKERFDAGADGLLTAALRELIKLRKVWSTKKTATSPGTPEWKDADRKSTAYKVVANSFYGVVGSSSSRFFDADVAESVTTTGRWLIQRTIEEGKKASYGGPQLITIYADTDSCFVRGCSRNDFENFVEWCNRELYPKLLSEHGCIENHIKLAYEKQFERMVFVSAKKYTGAFAHYKGTAATADSKPEIKGLAYKRGDSALLARRMQGRVIDMLMCAREERASEFRKIVEEVKERVLNGELAREEFVIAKSLSKSLREYVPKKKIDGGDAAEPAHVTVARTLKEQGFEVHEGTKIEYVVIDGEDGIKAVSAIDYNGECDRYYLWESLVYPATQGLLQAAFPEHDWVSGLEKVRPKYSKRATPLKGQTMLLGAEQYVVEVDERQVGISIVEKLRDLATRHPGPARLIIKIKTQDGAVAELVTPFGILPSSAFRVEFREITTRAGEYKVFEEAYSCVSW